MTLKSATQNNQATKTMPKNKNEPKLPPGVTVGKPDSSTIKAGLPKPLVAKVGTLKVEEGPLMAKATTFHVDAKPLTAKIETLRAEEKPPYSKPTIIGASSRDRIFCPCPYMEGGGV